MLYNNATMVAYSEESERNNIPSVAYPSVSGLNEQTYTHIIQWGVREKQHPISRIPQRVRIKWTNIYTHHTVRSQRETTSHQSHTPACQDWMNKHIHTSYSEKSERNNIPSVAYPSVSGLNEQTYTHIIQWEVREKQHPISRIPQRVRTEWANIYTHHTVRSQRETISHQSHTPACQDWMNKHIHTSFAYSQITHSLLVIFIFHTWLHIDCLF